VNEGILPESVYKPIGKDRVQMYKGIYRCKQKPVFKIDLKLLYSSYTGLINIYFRNKINIDFPSGNYQTE